MARHINFDEVEPDSNILYSTLLLGVRTGSIV